MLYVLPEIGAIFEFLCDYNLYNKFVTCDRFITPSNDCCVRLLLEYVLKLHISKYVLQNRPHVANLIKVFSGCPK